ncbi:hypothetical protein CPB83DRAFT_836189 [Crepidotus variabilis]|uniref:F-box domain-containing protein n=1 Tax=Crepidotus variabilis TaxID=179855 RepID=A0A9P6EFH8_9AGAR|nr:hypothetical protein CPB83DRAFT_836189 [Crepidotus variabilis]
MDLKPPIPRLLETNDLPSLEDIDVISTSIRAAKAALFSTHSKLAQQAAGTERDALLRQLESCYIFIRQQCGVVSALRFLPNEILSTIFAFACEQDASSLNVPKHISAIQPHIGLSRVCRLWRDVVHQTPNLWVNIPTCGVDDSISPQPKLHFIKTYIRRSGAAPLNISLRLRLSSLAEGTTEDWQSMQLVLSQAERWQVLDLTTSDDGLRYLHIRTQIQNRLPHLEALTLRLPLIKVLSPDQTAHHDVFLNTPALRNLRIAAHHSHSIGRKLDFPWTTLHSFHGVLPVDSPLGRNFRHVSAVLHLFEYIKIKPKPGLRLLHVDPSIAKPNFTLNKDFPDLEVLKLVNTSADMLITSLRRMVTNSAQIHETESFRHLTTLEFSSPQVDQIALASFLEWTPRVTSFSLRNFQQINLLEVFSRLHPIVLPNLSLLTIIQQNSNNPKIFAKLLTNIVTSRKGTALSIECHLPRHQCLSVLYALEGLQTRIEELHKRETTGESELLAKYYVDLAKCVFGGSKDQRIKEWLFMDLLLKSVENHVLVDALNLERSNLINVLTDIATLPDGLILEEDYFIFQTRAQEILRRWHPALDLIRKDRKWVLKEEDGTVLSYNSRTESSDTNFSSD